ncbi:hypothetical protein BGC33_09815 [Bathymodiolus thermophilus thioautotrophic gill symbiont]|uniref:Uncharacterized protein n=1 Tax=Bathymodiolus thermophilus thioautotrophic gill symbiont TaxID=2360 RepID=A0A1J5TTS8_9GAMM|nr:hypothetical protein BGC33_09815 [Bathymodiolus thermophilus thioautotrophic gill symbiont]
MDFLITEFNDITACRFNNFNFFSFIILRKLFKYSLNFAKTGLNKPLIWQKLNFINHPYLC